MTELLVVKKVNYLVGLSVFRREKAQHRLFFNDPLSAAIFFRCIAPSHILTVFIGIILCMNLTE